MADSNEFFPIFITVIFSSSQHIASFSWIIISVSRSFQYSIQLHFLFTLRMESVAAFCIPKKNSWTKLPRPLMADIWIQKVSRFLIKIPYLRLQKFYDLSDSMMLLSEAESTFNVRLIIIGKWPLIACLTTRII